MNIAEILKDCPKGAKLYSPIYGEVSLNEVDVDEDYPISILNSSNVIIERFTSEGKVYNKYQDGECMLFPSKENRDWSTFKTPKKKKGHDFKAFDRVLVRDNHDCIWKASLFSHYCNDKEKFRYVTVSGNYMWCIPFKGNEHLVGTNKCV